MQTPIRDIRLDQLIKKLRMERITEEEQMEIADRLQMMRDDLERLRKILELAEESLKPFEVHIPRI